uniref:Uncharacterized protein n=1 Tax=Knipowitschia caucasica TaxID=637954 RepID=A0AAV2JP29_KNICA
MLSERQDAGGSAFSIRASGKATVILDRAEQRSATVWMEISDWRRAAIFSCAMNTKHWSVTKRHRAADLSALLAQTRLVAPRDMSVPHIHRAVCASVSLNMSDPQIAAVVCVLGRCSHTLEDGKVLLHVHEPEQCSSALSSAPTVLQGAACVQGFTASSAQSVLKEPSHTGTLTTDNIKIMKNEKQSCWVSEALEVLIMD